MSYKLTRREGAKFEQGFSMLELMLVLLVAGTIGAFAVVRIQSARESLNLQNSVRQLAGQIEKARLDAVRRHSTSQVVFDSNSSYNVTMDFDGSGTPYTKNYRMPGDIAIPPGSPLPSISFNWRGRTSACTNTFAFQNSSGLQSWVDVSDAGDVTINSDADVLPSVSFATVSTTGGIAPTTVVSGTGTHSNVLDCDTSTAGTAGPPVTGTGSGGCTLTVNPSSLSIKKNGGTTGSIVVGANTSGTVGASGPGNLKILPATQSLAANGSVTFSVTSLNSTRSTFAVNFTSPCTTVTTLVKVVN